MPAVICLVPVRNEAWILDRFLKCASLWADHIILADQGSTDGSREIAGAFPKVRVIQNISPAFSEVDRQRKLIEEARKIPSPRLLIALDADEVLTANVLESPEWNTVLSATTGTVICFRWVNLRPDMSSYSTPDIEFAWGFVDDESEHTGVLIHNPRLPTPQGAMKISMREIKVLHYQFTNVKRMRHKHCWYQMWERLTYPSRRPISIFRQYHHMDALLDSDIKPLPSEWISGYQFKGIDMTSICDESTYWWDREIVNWIAEYGSAHFRKEAIWDIDWKLVARNARMAVDEDKLGDPRNVFERAVHRWLHATQASSSQAPVRVVNRFLRMLGW